MQQLTLRLRDDIHRSHVIQKSHATHDGRASIRACVRPRDAERAAAIIQERLQVACDDLMLTQSRDEPAAANDDE